MSADVGQPYNTLSLSLKRANCSVCLFCFVWATIGVVVAFVNTSILY